MLPSDVAQIAAHFGNGIPADGTHRVVIHNQTVVTVLCKGRENRKHVCMGHRRIRSLEEAADLAEAEEMLEEERKGRS